MQGTSILLLEDEEAFAQSLVRVLERLEPGWHVDWTPDPADVTASANRYGCFLIDWNLRGTRSGLAVCNDLRRGGCAAALIILSCRHAVEDRILAMEMGADDFVTKRAEPDELRARIHVALARASARKSAAPAMLSWGPLSACLLEQQVLVDGKQVDLTRHQWLILVRLLRDPGQPVPPTELCQFAGIQSDLTHQNLRTEMRRLRQRLGDAGAFIRVQRGSGYCLSTADGQSVGNDT